MTISLITGPPNSGRAGVLLRSFAERMRRDPVLCVPTADDHARFEGELARGGAILGGRVTSMAGLAGEVARSAGLPAGDPLHPAQRRLLLRRAVASCAGHGRLRALARASSRPGFAEAVGEAIAELEAALVDADDLTERARGLGDPRPVRELAEIHRTYAALRARTGRSDTEQRTAEAARALAAAPDAWGARPVFLYGFDDLSEAQLALVGAMAGSAEVTVALAFEDRKSLAARATLRERLSEIGGRVAEELSADPGNTDSAALFRIARGFGEAGPEPVEPGSDLRFLEAGGRQAEAELIAAHVARLLGEGEPADEIAVVLRSPEALGPALAGALERYGIPAAVDGHLALAETATGRSLLAGIRALGPDGSAADAIAHLRGVGAPGAVDALERASRRRGLRGAEELLGEWRGPRDEIDALAARGPDLARAVSWVARRLAEQPHRREGAVPSGLDGIELRAGALAAEAAEAALELGDVDVDEILEVLSGVRVPLWRGHGGPPTGHVRVLSPYRARARRVRHLVVGSLQEGEFPRRAPAPGLIAEDDRQALGLPPRSAQEDEERYLFAVCLSRPTRTLALSYRVSDDDGSATAPSPFVEDVRVLLSPPATAGQPDPLRPSLVVARPLSDAVFEPAGAPSERELARALAALGPETAADLARSGGAASRLAPRIARAARRAAALPGPLVDQFVIERLGAREAFSATQLETWIGCPYRWFVEHELAPGELEPDPEPLAEGGVAHTALERLYGERPGGTRRPRPATLPAWKERLEALVSEVWAERRPGDAAALAARDRLLAHLRAHLEREARSEADAEPAMLELGFGFDDPPVEVEGVPLRGKIDRVDLGPGGLAVIRDYKLSSGATPVARFEEDGRLQLPLYLAALRRLRPDLDPAGALYEPLRARPDAKPRGMVREDAADAAGLHASTDRRDRDAFEAEIDRAARSAAAAAQELAAGRIARRPIGGSCPRWCRCAPICRRERGRPEEAEVEERGKGEGESEPGG